MMISNNTVIDIQEVILIEQFNFGDKFQVLIDL